MKKSFKCNVISGKLVGGEPITAYLKTLKDGRMLITISTGVDAEKKPRSNDQNAYYWGVVVHNYREAMLQVGDDSMVHYAKAQKLTLDEATHEYLLNEFAGYEIVDYSTGEVKKLPSRSKAMSTTEFMTYVDTIIRECMDRYDHEIPPPPEREYYG